LFSSCEKDNLVKNNSILLFEKEYLNKSDKKQKNKYLDSIVESLQNKKNDSVSRSLYLKVACKYYYNNEINKSLHIGLKVLQLSTKAKDSIRIPKALYYIGDCYENTKKDSAYYYYLQAEKLYFKIHDYDNVGRMLFNKAYVLFYDGNYLECEVQLSKALQYLKESENLRLIYSCNTLMGNCLEKLVDYDEALKYHRRAFVNLKKLKINNNDEDEINNYNVTSIINICNLYDLKGEYSKSIKELQTLPLNSLKKNWPRLYANVISNLAYSKMKNGDYKNVGPMFFESLKIVDSIGIDSDILYKKIHIGEYFLTQMDTLKSIESLKEANQLAIKIKNSNEILSTLKVLLKIDKKNKFYYANEYIKVSDSINMVQKNTHNKYARIEFETSMIKDQNKVLTKENFYILIISFGFVLVLTILIVIKYLKYKNKELHFLEENQKASEEIYLLITEQHEKINAAKDNEKAKIAKELHDGVMNKIYGVRMNLGFFNSKIDDNIIEKRKGYIFELQNIENEIRTISHDLSRGSFLEGNDFSVLLLGLIEDQNESNNTVFEYLNDESLDWTIIQNISKINLYRIIQEAILNVNKYSHAKNCLVKIQMKYDNLVQLSIIDNGIGFDIEKEKMGIGLSNIKERVSFLNGQFIIESKIGEGTKIEITFEF
jgi:signal transduction histidine kinase